MKIRNISGGDLFVPGLNKVVKADDVVVVPDAAASGYTCQKATWRAESSPNHKKTEKE